MEGSKRLIAEGDIYALFNESGTARLHVADIDVIPRVDAVGGCRGSGAWRWKRGIVDFAAPYSWKVECSNCDFDICGLGDAYLFKYCPNCGAKMDGGSNDG